ncbi:MAG: hypothetical protein M1834_000459 [Cirrosporium novae-zelandiae]|nr:MAG: hypothetical protein M1834_000459 [Cirrosporium novae-zelandiae]
MVPSSLAQRRTHNLLLFSNLLDLRDNSSPFTLILDSLEQSGKPLVGEFFRKNPTTKTRVIFISYETSHKPENVNTFIKGWDKTAPLVQHEVAQELQKDPQKKFLVIIDSLSNLAADPTMNLPAFLSLFITPSSSVIAIYHLDVPIYILDSAKYAPHPLTLLKYFATTIYTVHSFSHVLARREAADKSLPEPAFGLAEEIEGVIKGLGSDDKRGVVVEMEHRRKSGRTVGEWFFLSSSTASAASKGHQRRRTILLDDHPLYRLKEEVGARESAGEVVAESTFSLGLTEKQRQDRENVILPYFDAQKGEGGIGGRILYDMGEEDDFDDEEDEI